MEGAVGGRPADAPLPPGIGEVEKGGGQIAFSKAGGGVDQDAGAPGDADPGAGGGAEFGVDPLEEIVGEGNEDADLFQSAEGAGILGKEEIGGAAVALLQDGDGEFGGLAVADAQVDAGVGFKLLEDRLHQCLAAPRINGQGAGVVIVISAAGDGG